MLCELSQTLCELRQTLCELSQTLCELSQTLCVLPQTLYGLPQMLYQLLLSPAIPVVPAKHDTVTPCAAVTPSADLKTDSP